MPRKQPFAKIAWLIRSVELEAIGQVAAASTPTPPLVPAAQRGADALISNDGRRLTTTALAESRDEERAG
ncbi:hypothetical protein [Streptomyces rimosus]|uniref:hypothetical protein n=1 Tax=Streptomyces rimosus TaxID=1927 RepID=UPI00131B881C|nr:hypothetical protein [Streptomyces rimosus]